MLVKLKPKEIERLINYIESGEKRLEEAKLIALNNVRDFNTWIRFSTEKTRVDYPAMLGIQTKVGAMIYNYANWLRVDRFHGMIITLEHVLEMANILLEQGFITEKYVEELKQELVEINFNSMKNI